MTDASQNVALLDDTALDSVCGGAGAPPEPPRPLPGTRTGPRFEQGLMFGAYLGADGTVRCGKLPLGALNQIPQL